MKKQLYTSYYLNAYEWNLVPIFEIEWLCTTEFALEEDFTIAINNLLENRQLKYVLIDASQLFLFLEIDFQIEMVIYAMKKIIELGCEKLAIIPPNDYISQLTIKQLLEEIYRLKLNKMLKINCLNHTLEAEQWLKKKH